MLFTNFGKKIFFFLVFFSWQIANGQFSIINPDFELYTTCPTYLGQVANSVGWVDVILNADYYNCGLSTAPYNSNSTAYSGTGFIGFASYGDQNGSAEAFGQTLSSPLLPGFSFSLSFEAKKTTSGIFSDTCGGVAIYGFKNIPPLGGTAIHLSQLPSPILVGISNPVQDSSWNSFTINFSPIDTINFLAFTIQQSPSCHECIFLDNLLLSNPESVSEIDNSFEVYPNPGHGFISVNGKMKIEELSVYDILGRREFYSKINDTKASFTLYEPGIYFIYIRSNEKVLVKKIVVSE